MQRLLKNNAIVALICTGVIVVLGELGAFETSFVGWGVLFIVAVVFFAASCTLPAESWHGIVVPLIFAVVGPLIVWLLCGLIGYIIHRSP
jgi:hypothetical protein